MNWTPVDTKTGPNITVTLNQGSWKEGTFYCYETDKNCFYCDNFKFTDGYNGKCKVPFYVQTLLSKGVLPPNKPRFTHGFSKAQ